MLKKMSVAAMALALGFGGWPDLAHAQELPKVN
jgi:hypothetical protein